MAKKGKSAVKSVGKATKNKAKQISTGANVSVNKVGGDVDYAAKGSKHTMSSETGKSNRKNILDDFIRGADRGNQLSSELKKFSDLTGFSWNPEAILNSEGITTSRLTSKVLNTTRININHAPSQVDFTNFGKMYAFFTKPDLYLFTDDKFSINQSIKDNYEDLYAKIQRNLPVASALQIGTGATPSYGSSGGLNTLLGNLCNEIEVPEVNMSVTPAAKNSKGTGISYVGDFFESLQEGSISISFIDTRDKDITTQLEIWSMYAEGERRGIIYKKPDYIGKNVIDYACTIYIMAVDESNNILGITALIGCFPISLNTDLLKYRATQLVAQDFIGPFTWTFHVSHIAKPNIHKTVDSFNYVTGYGAKILKGGGDKNPHNLIYRKQGEYWHHTGVTMDHGFITDYPYHFTLEDKWAELVGINQSLQSSGVVNYTLGFASRNVGKPVSPDDFWTGTKYEDRGSRWKDGAYTRYDEGGIVEDEPMVEDTLKAEGIGNAVNFATLDNKTLYAPYTLDGNPGLYQGNWSSWNTGDSRYGTPTASSTSNNSNMFREALRFLGGGRGR